MSSTGRRKGNDSTSSGHGALGMGGQPSDKPRDAAGGGRAELDDDRGGGTGPIPGASGHARDDVSAGNVAGVKGDKAIDQEIQTEVEKRD